MADAVVIGSGPNGLVAANMLADAGWSVIVLEAATQPGGSVRTAELTVPGFHHDLFSAFYPLALASPALSDLELEDFGLRWCHAPAVLAHPLPEGRSALISTDLDATAACLDDLAPGDGAAWREMIAEWDRIAKPLLRLLFQPFPPIRPALELWRRTGLLGLERFIRHALLPVRRMTEERFAAEGSRLLLGGCALHSDLSPDAAGSGFYGWLLACLAQRVGFPVPEGGAGTLSDALVARLCSRGGAVRCATRASEILVRRGRAVAVRTAGGEVLDATHAVIADVSAPALYGELLDAALLPAGLLNDVSRFQWDMATVKVDWALDAPVPWTAAGARQAGTVHVADDVDNLTEFAAEISMGRLSSRPFLVFGQQSLADPTRSPEGTETAWAYTHVPRRVRSDGSGEIDVSGGEESWLAGFVARIEDRIEALAPGFSSHILGRHVFSPSGLCAENPNLVGGAIGGGTSQLHQQLVLRPVPGAGRAETPIEALFLASSSAHPGGGVHGAAGSNAARAALARGARVRSLIFARAERENTWSPATNRASGGPERHEERPL